MEKHVVRRLLVLTLLAAPACTGGTGGTDDTTNDLAMGKRPWAAAAETEVTRSCVR